MSPFICISLWILTVASMPVSDDVIENSTVECPDNSWCPLHCQYSSFLTDTRGCPLCQCDTSICQGEPCPLETECRLLNFATPGRRYNIQARCIDATQYIAGCGYPSCSFDYSCPQPFATQPDGCEVCTCDRDAYSSSNNNNNNNENDNNKAVDNQNITIPTTTAPSRHIGTMCNNEIKTSCYMHCEHGYQYDANGCFTCSCSERFINNKAICEAFGEDMTTCRLTCAEFERDTYGCSMCDCKPPTDCPKLACEEECTTDYLKDASGCHTCNCSVIGECDTTYINSFCDWPECVFGYAQDKKGCDMCQCNSNPKGMFVDQEFLNDTDSRPLRKKQGQKTNTDNSTMDDANKMLIVFIILAVLLIIILVILVVVLYCVIKKFCCKATSEPNADRFSNISDGSEVSEIDREKQPMLDTTQQSQQEPSPNNNNALVNDDDDSIPEKLDLTLATEGNSVGDPEEVEMSAVTIASEKDEITPEKVPLVESTPATPSAPIAEESEESEEDNDSDDSDDVEPVKKEEHLKW